MPHTVKIYTFETIVPPSEADHPKARLVLTAAMADANQSHQWCCRPMDLEPMADSNVVKAKGRYKYYDWTACRWCGQTWSYVEFTDSNGEDFSSYKEALKPEVEVKVVFTPSGAKASDIPKAFSTGIRCPHCQGILVKGYMTTVYFCNLCNYGRTTKVQEVINRGNCPCCLPGVLIKMGESIQEVKCSDCKFEGRRLQ